MPNDLPNINDMEVILVAYETNIFSQVGRQLNMSHPAISQINDKVPSH